MKLCTNCIPVMLAQSNLIPVKAQVFMVGSALIALDCIKEDDQRKSV